MHHSRQPFGAARPARGSGQRAASPASSALDPATLPAGISRYNWPTASPAELDGYQQLAMHDKSRDQMLTAINYAQQPDEIAQASLADARIEPSQWGRIPRTYVRLTLDRLVPPELADRMISDADTATPDHRFAVHDIATSHLGVIFHAQELAKILTS